MNAVTCLQWIGRGIAKQQPDQVKLQEADLNNLIDTVKGTTLSDSDEGDRQEEHTEKRKRKLPKGKDMSSGADKADEDDDSDKADVDSEEEGASNPLSFAGIAYYGGDAKDPNLIEGTDSDDEDMEILPDDNLITIGKVKKDFCTLEVYVYNEKDNNCWCHHELLLPTIPLCMEWLDFDAGEEKPGNLMAVGSVGPDIEIWDLDVVNTLEPAYVLTGVESRSGKKKKKKAVSGHSDAVLALSWNKPYRHALASGSADCTAALWDLSEGKLVTSIKHPDKVQALQWQPLDAQSLLTGCANKTVNLYDCRTLEPTKKTWSVNGEVEHVLWNTFEPRYFFAGTDAGSVYYFDSRMDKEVFQLKGHTEAVSSLAQSSKIPGCLVTAGSDKIINVWDVKESVPRKVFTKKLDMGQLFNVSSCPDFPLLFAVAGELEFRVLNFAKNPTITECFGMESNDSVILKAGDIEVPIGYDDDKHESSSEEEKEKEQLNENSNNAESKNKRKKKKATRKYTAELRVTETRSEAAEGACSEIKIDEKKESQRPGSGKAKKDNPSHPAARRQKYKNKRKKPSGGKGHIRF